MLPVIHNAVVQHWISRTYTGGAGIQGTPSCAAPEGSAGIAGACAESPVQTAAVPQGAAAEAPAQVVAPAQSWRVAMPPRRLCGTLERLGVRTSCRRCKPSQRAREAREPAAIEAAVGSSQTAALRWAVGKDRASKPDMFGRHKQGELSSSGDNNRASTSRDFHDCAASTCSVCMHGILLEKNPLEPES
jgi:hypothetical protein